MTSAYAQGREYRRELKIREYLQKQPGQSSGAPMYDTAVHVLQELGLYVSDKRANDWWGSLFDLQTAGVVIVEPDGSSCRLATVEELKARLTGELVPDGPIVLTLNLLERNGR
jgi:hypothetical protein